jgi:hypothetical protein
MRLENIRILTIWRAGYSYFEQHVFDGINTGDP